MPMGRAQRGVPRLHCPLQGARVSCVGPGLQVCTYVYMILEGREGGGGTKRGVGWREERVEEGWVVRGSVREEGPEGV